MPWSALFVWSYRGSLNIVLSSGSCCIEWNFSMKFFGLRSAKLYYKSQRCLISEFVFEGQFHWFQDWSNSQSVVVIGLSRWYILFEFNVRFFIFKEGIEPSSKAGEKLVSFLDVATRYGIRNEKKVGRVKYWCGLSTFDVNLTGSPIAVTGISDAWFNLALIGFTKKNTSPISSFPFSALVLVRKTE